MNYGCLHLGRKESVAFRSLPAQLYPRAIRYKKSHPLRWSRKNCRIWKNEQDFLLQSTVVMNHYRCTRVIVRFLSHLLDKINNRLFFSTCHQTTYVGRYMLSITLQNQMSRNESTHTVGTYCSGNFFFVNMIRIHVLPTVPSPTTVNLKGLLSRFIFCFRSFHDQWRFVEMLF